MALHIENVVIAKVYLTSAFNQRRHTRRLAEALQELDYVVTSKWVNDIEVPVAMFDKGSAAVRNIMAISGSDIIVAVGPTVSRKVSFEMGYAHACGLRVMMVGGVTDPLHLYDMLPHQRFATEEDFMVAMRKVSMFRFHKGEL